MRIEGEALVAKYQPGRGSGKAQGMAQGMARFAGLWSGDSQLWRTGGQPGDVYTVKLDGVASGTKSVTVFPTMAKDYARVKIAINGQLREVDLYSEAVKPGEPIRFEGVNISPSEPLQIDIHITGANPQAKPSHMVGIDRIEVE